MDTDLSFRDALNLASQMAGHYRVFQRAEEVLRRATQAEAEAKDREKKVGLLKAESTEIKAALESLRVEGEAAKKKVADDLAAARDDAEKEIVRTKETLRAECESLAHDLGQAKEAHRSEMRRMVQTQMQRKAEVEKQMAEVVSEGEERKIALNADIADAQNALASLRAEIEGIRARLQGI